MSKPKKEFGQNFLIRKSVVNDLLRVTDLSKKDVVIEVGAGKGFVTEELSKTVKNVIAVELDRDLIPILKDKFPSTSNAEIINDDILNLLDQHFNDLNHYTKNKFKIVGSIPYQITSPLIHKILYLEHLPTSATLLVQYEVAKKITASPPKANYLSIFVQTFAEVKYIKKVKKESFRPIPKVDGAIINISFPASAKGGSVSDRKRYSRFLHKGFSSPRKMLNKIFSSNILENVGISPQARPQELSVEQWLKLYTNTNK